MKMGCLLEPNEPSNCSSSGSQAFKLQKQKKLKSNEKDNKPTNKIVLSAEASATGARTSCAMPKAQFYLKDQVALGARLVQVGTVSASSFRSLFLKILQDLESEEHKIIDRKRESRVDRKNELWTEKMKEFDWWENGDGKRMHRSQTLGRVQAERNNLKIFQILFYYWPFLSQSCILCHSPHIQQAGKWRLFFLNRERKIDLLGPSLE